MWLHKAIVTVLGLGMAPIAPGTFGALGAVLLYFILYYLNIPFDLVPLLFAISVISLIGIWSTNALLKDWGEDPSKVVIDEFVGILVTMILIPINPFNIIVGFVLFRFFDILKPLGVRYIDKNVKGGLGVMLDDVLAGIYACLLLHLILFLIN